jgi:hypothetical protein
MVNRYSPEARDRQEYNRNLCIDINGKEYGFHTLVFDDSGLRYCERCGVIVPSVSDQLKAKNKAS